MLCYISDMKKTALFLGTGLLALTVSLFLGEVPAASAAYLSYTPTAYEPAVPEATVNLYCRIKSGNKTLGVTGSGVFIDERGIILTNAHVGQYFLLASSTSRLKSDCSVRTGSPAKAAYDAEVLYLSPAWSTAYATIVAENDQKGTGEYDFALLYVTKVRGKQKTVPERFPAMPFGTTATVTDGDEVLAAGYPAEGLGFKEVRSKLEARAASSTITSVRTFASNTPDVIGLSPSSVARSGVSGGPIVYAGSLVGIATTMGTSNIDNPSLRGISISYIERILRAETGLSLLSLHTTDLAARSQLTYAMQTPVFIKSIEKGLRRIR